MDGSIIYGPGLGAATDRSSLAVTGQMDAYFMLLKKRQDWVKANYSVFGASSYVETDYNLICENKGDICILSIYNSNTGTKIALGEIHK